MMTVRDSGELVKILRAHAASVNKAYCFIQISVRKHCTTKKFSGARNMIGQVGNTPGKSHVFVKENNGEY